MIEIEELSPPFPDDPKPKQPFEAGPPPSPAGDMDEVLTMAEIEKRFDQEWVLIDDYVSNEWQKVLCGRVLYHSKDRDEVWRKVLLLRPKRCAVHYIGEMIIPESAEIIL